jgi:hypothetical protein
VIAPERSRPWPAVVAAGAVVLLLSGLAACDSATTPDTSEDPCTALGALCPYCTRPGAEEAGVEEECQAAVTNADDGQCAAILAEPSVQQYCVPSDGGTDASKSDAAPPPCGATTSPDAGCTCTGPQCAPSCPGGGCVFTCASGTCSPTCAGGGCHLECEQGATCKGSCAGGDCTFTCVSGSQCANTCVGGGCPFQCSVGAVCNDTCGTATTCVGE